MAQLENKNIHPVLAVILNWFVLCILGYILIGQTNKSLFVFAAIFIGTCLCAVPGIIVFVLSLVDVYMVAEAVKNGEAIDENEYKMEMLYKICKMIHKDAVFKG